MPHTTPCLPCHQAPIWPALEAHARHLRAHFDLRTAFAEGGAARFARFSQQMPQGFVDLSKNLWDETAHELLLQLAEECAVGQQRTALFAAERINRSENRPALHPLLRCPREEVPENLQAYGAAIQNTLDCMYSYAEGIRAQSDITDVVCLGIGGSSLGPQLAVQALCLRPTRPRLHFVSNVDAHALDAVLHGLRARHTLVVAASKTFSTQETATNLRSCLQWFARQGGTDTARHFVALTSRVEAAEKWGIKTCFGFDEGVGGRYSLWSSIGLPVAIAAGPDAFHALLRGARAMDEHFCQAPPEANAPLRLGLLDVWNRNLLGFASRCVAPYHAGLARLPAYLQQLEMESNGKGVDWQGRPLALHSAPVIWGEPGTDAQHAFFQMLHQGTEIAPLEIIAVRQPSYESDDFPGHHAQLLANAIAQAQALMQGRANPDDPQRHFPGNRPSSFILLEALTPEALGALIALYEHRVFVSGALWGINSFDQWGVELGKVLASDILARMDSRDSAGLDASTAGLLRRLG